MQQELVFPLYQLRANNIAEASENRMHSDEVARAHGFSGSLVPGVAVYAYLTRPLVAQFGADWLNNHFVEVVFHKPVYHDDALSIEVSVNGASDGRGHTVTCLNEEGVVVASMLSKPWADPGPVDHLMTLDDFPLLRPGTSRPEATWETVNEGAFLWRLSWDISEAQHQEWCDGVRDNLALYQGPQALIHPGLVLQAANAVLMQSFLLPAWIHVSSQITMTAPARLGEEIWVGAQVERKWNAKGHHFCDLDVSVFQSKKNIVRIRHRVIFHPKKR